jgi:hypothetical protein
VGDHAINPMASGGAQISKSVANFDVSKQLVTQMAGFS